MNDNLRENAERGAFSGKIGYVLATAGSAVGLGNIWRFPYLAARYGGGIFLLVYLVLQPYSSFFIFRMAKIRTKNETESKINKKHST